MAHSPLGGPSARGASTGTRSRPVAAASNATPAEVSLAWLLALSPVVVPIPGARRPETARSAARSAALDLDADDAAALTRAFGRPRVERPRSRAGAEVVVVMGIPGAGKSRVAEEFVARGYDRLNRDERGGRCARSGPARGALASPSRASCSTTRISRATHAARSSTQRLVMGLPSAASGSTLRSHRRR